MALKLPSVGNRLPRLPEEPRRHRDDARATSMREGLDSRRPGLLPGRHRQHLRLHRPGQGRIGERGPPAGPAARRRERSTGSSSRGAWSRSTGPSSRRRFPRSITSSGSTSWRMYTGRRARPPFAPALHGQAACHAPLRRPRAARPDGTTRLRVPQSGRGVQQPVHLLHHPADARPPAVSRTVESLVREALLARGAGSLGARPDLAGHDPLRRGRRARSGGAHDTGLDPSSARRRCPGFVPLPDAYPKTLHESVLRLMARRTPVRSLCRHPAPARVAPGPCRDAPRRRSREPCPHVCRDARDGPGNRPEDDVHRRIPVRDGDRLRGATGLREGGRVRPPRRFPVFPRSPGRGRKGSAIRFRPR